MGFAYNTGHSNALCGIRVRFSCMKSVEIGAKGYKMSYFNERAVPSAVLGSMNETDCASILKS
jgi:hypothetical protein